jgi:hypothetical protein
MNSQDPALGQQSITPRHQVQNLKRKEQKKEEEERGRGGGKVEKIKGEEK